MQRKILGVGPTVYYTIIWVIWLGLPSSHVCLTLGMNGEPNLRTMRMRIKYSVPISERCECESNIPYQFQNDANANRVKTSRIIAIIANNCKIITNNHTYLHANTMYIEHRDCDLNANILKTSRLLRFEASKRSSVHPYFKLCQGKIGVLSDKITREWGKGYPNSPLV